MGVKQNSKAYQNLAYDIKQAELRRKDAKLSMRAYLDDEEHGGEGPFAGADTAQIDAYSDALKRMEQAISPVKLALSSVAVTAGKTGEAIAKMAGAAVLAGIRAMGAAAAEAARNLASMTSRAIVSGVKRLGAWLSNAARSMLIFQRASKRNNGVLKRGFMTILRYGLGIRSLYFLFNKIRSAIKEGFQNLVQYSDDVNKSVSGMISSFSRFKNQFAASFAPIVNIAAPALARFIDLLSEATFRTGELLAALSGKKAVIKAKEVEEDYAESLKKEKEQKAELREETRAAIAKQSQYANTTDESAESLDEETEAAKKLKRQLAGFDELNILKVDKEDDAKREDLFETVPIDFEMTDLAGKIKEMWNALNLSGLGDILGSKIKIALDDIPWDKIKQGASNLGKLLASFLNGQINSPKLGYSLGFALADALNSAFAFLDAFARTLDWKGLGNAIMSTIEGFADGLDWNLINRALQGLALGIADLLIAIFNREKVWEKIGVTLGKALNAVVNAGIAFLEKFDFAQAARAIVIGLNAAIRTIQWNRIGRLLALFFSGVLRFFHTAATEFDWKGLADGIAEGLNAFVATMREKIKDLNPREVGEAIGQFINDCFAGVEWGDFGTLVGELVGGAFSIVATAIRSLRLSDIVQAIQDFFSNALRQIDFYDILTVWGVAALITAVNAIIKKHPVLALLSAAVMALGPELGSVISRMIETIPFAEIGANLSAFLIAALNRLHDAIKSVDWFSLGKSVGQFLGNINWSEIVNSVIKVIGDLIVAGFQTLGGIIVGMGPKGIANALWALVKAVGALIVGGSMLTLLSASVKGLLSSLALTITSGITGLSLPIAGAITSLLGAIA
ncbi:MAG: hypothetical protein IJG24_02590, partial [Selenomonadaceae bacterium]|nr:hypothetical protein [Selenomonadaceae bacterium]